MKKTTSLFAGLVLVVALFIVSPGFARMNGVMDNGVMGNGFSNGTPTGNPIMGGCQCQATNLTPEQQAIAKAIEDIYADQFAENARMLKAKIDELALIIANDQTTLAQVNSLRAEFYLLKQECRQLRSSVNQEIGNALGTAYCVNCLNCDSEDCQCRAAQCNQDCPATRGAVNGGCTGRCDGPNQRL